jgi:NAD(P)-dependent dehydrogenase (short-subunit alcohol dehydrogenase family)
MANMLAGRVAVVTGAGRGIGRGVALGLAAEGAKVVVNDYGVGLDGSAPSSGPAFDVVEEIRRAGGEAVANTDSVAAWDGAARIVGAALERWGRLDALVTCAGILRDRMVFNMGEEEWDAVIAVHLKGTFNCVRHACTHMRERRYGRIVTFSSGAGLFGNPGQANYGAAKSGIAGFTRVVAKDLGRYGVTCNAIAPGAATRMTTTVTETARDLRSRAGVATPAGPRPAASAPTMRDPEYVAPMAASLASDDAWNINGQIFHVAGGTVGVAHHPTPMRTLWKPGMWTLDELATAVPGQLMAGVSNPAPPPPDLEVRGREARQAAPSPAGGAA